jgi:polyisoprenoid-binding protein YceI
MAEDHLRRTIASLALVLAWLAPFAIFAAEEPPQPTGPIPHGHKDVTLALAGHYKLDPDHAGVIARVSHVGFSRSVFRFDRVSGELAWDPKQIYRSKLSAEVETGSIATNVANFAAQLAGPKYLNAPAFPKAIFVSTAFRPIDATHGKVDGTFTLMGKSKPVTFDVSLVGAGPFFGHYVIGIHAETSINPQDFGLPDVFDEPIELVIDTEFNRPA